MAHKLLPAIGVEVDAAAVGRHYGVRGRGGLLDLWVVDGGDSSAAESLSAEGQPTVATDLIMSSPAATSTFVQTAVASLL
jgi:LPPG:FO 2-phospho-L-lactate transferase